MKDAEVLLEEDVESDYEEESAFSYDFPLWADPLLEIYFKDISRRELFTEREEERLFKQLKQAAGKDEYLQIRNCIAEANLRLVVAVAKAFSHFSGPSIAFSDLISEGNLGLIKAIDKFRPEKKCRFSTYAFHWIRQGIERAIADKGNTIRIPVHIREKLKILRQLEKHEQAFETTEEVAEALEVNIGKAQKILAAKMLIAPRSLNYVLRFDDEPTELIELLEDHSSSLPEDEIMATLSRKELLGLLNCLKPKQCEVIKLRFGFDDNGPRTLEEVGEVFGITRERVRQIERDGLEKLRRLIKTKHLEDLKP